MIKRLRAIRPTPNTSYVTNLHRKDKLALKFFSKEWYSGWQRTEILEVQGTFSVVVTKKYPVVV
jgi:hypothetical protein